VSVRDDRFAFALLVVVGSMWDKRVCWVGQNQGLKGIVRFERVAEARKDAILAELQVAWRSYKLMASSLFLSFESHRVVSGCNNYIVAQQDRFQGESYQSLGAKKQ
jgi:hypothetical protein